MIDVDPHLLIVDDDERIRTLLQKFLMRNGFLVTSARDAAHARRILSGLDFDLAILDVMMPGEDGLSLCKWVREKSEMPVMLLTAKGETDDRITGLEAGADDYLAKPFNLEEFQLRVERLIKRAAWSRAEAGKGSDPMGLSDATFTFGNNTIAFDTGIARCQSGTVHLTEQELKLLKLFIKHRGKPLSRSKILEIGWGYTGEMTTRTVDNFIVRFRKYFEENPKKPVFFRSVRSVGYLFDDGRRPD
jgi:DNA-binding response OmpR family regulator